MAKKKRKGNPAMKEAGAKKLEVWLDPTEMEALDKLAVDMRRPKAKVVRAVLRFVLNRGPTALDVLRNAAYDRGRV